MTDSATTPMRFEPPAPLALQAAFDGGRVTSDGGLVWLAEVVDRELGLCEEIASRVPEWRGPSVRHPLTTLVGQRVFQIASGYEDQNDADALRKDPLLKPVLGRLPETDPDLASQPTLSRPENAPGPKGVPAPHRPSPRRALRARARQGGGALARAPGPRLHRRPDPRRAGGLALPRLLRGQHMYHPLLVFDGETGQLVTAVLRPGNAHAGGGALAVLRRVVGRLREAWPEAEVEIRADAGFALPAVYGWCEREGVGYTIGLIPNPRLEAIALPLLERAERESRERGGEKVRLVADAPYEAGGWGRPRGVAYKAEATEKGTNTRFVVTSRRGEAPKDLYDRYVGRGETEGWIKDFKRASKADRLSRKRFWADQFGLLVHAAAYRLLDALRGKLIAAGTRRMQLDTLRLRLVKVGGRVRQLLTVVRMHPASSHPGQRLWRLLNESRRRARE